ncbi:energy-coupling factor ABC transporter permease [Geothrix rubra]
MHMADALVSAAVGGSFWALSGGALAGCSRRLRRDEDERRVPLMGVLGAFVFAVQMVNFAIPGTGSSGHLVGTLLLSALLGPPAAVLVMGSVLLVQALFFADGGLLAFGCNLFNMGILPALVAYPLVFRPLDRRGHPAAGAILGAVAALQLGALAVVLETVLSGLTGLPFRPFLLAMLPIHLPIGLAEGLATALLLRFLRRARPELAAVRPEPAGRPLLALVLGAAVLTAGMLSWAASSRPDGLEWSVSRVAPAGADAPDGAVHRFAARLQRRTSVLPEYALPGTEPAGPAASRRGTSLSGLLGGAATLGLVAGAGWLITRGRRILRARPEA